MDLPNITTPTRHFKQRHEVENKKHAKKHDDVSRCFADITEQIGQSNWEFGRGLSVHGVALSSKRIRLDHRVSF